MKNLLLLILSMLILSSCYKDSVLERNMNERIYRSWTITKYKVDKKDQLGSSSFSKTQFTIFKYSYSSPEIFYSTTGEIDSLQIRTKKIRYATGSEYILFPLEDYIDVQNQVDPFYYYHENKLMSEWKIKKMNKRILIITNEENEHNSLIELTFESNKNNGSWF